MINLTGNGVKNHVTQMAFQWIFKQNILLWILDTEQDRHLKKNLES